MKKAKFPLLDQMRAARQRREDEVTLPYRLELADAGRLINSLQKRLRDIEAFLGTKIAQAVTDRIGFEMAGKVRQIIMEAAAKAPNKASSFTVTLPKEIMGFMDMRSIENDILSRYRTDALPRLSLNIETAPPDFVTVMDIRVPNLGYRCAVDQAAR